MDLREMIQQSGYRTRWLSEQMGVSRSLLNYVMTGQRRLTEVQAEKLAILLRQTLDAVVKAGNRSFRQGQAVAH